MIPNRVTQVRVDTQIPELRKTNAALCRGKHNAALFYNPDQDVRTTMQGGFEYLLKDDGLKRINTQIQRRSETLEFKDSTLRPDSMMKTETTPV